MNAETLLNRNVRQLRKQGWLDHQIRGYERKWREVGANKNLIKQRQKNEQI